VTVKAGRALPEAAADAVRLLLGQIALLDRAVEG
jgi:hypothetical protein